MNAEGTSVRTGRAEPTAESVSPSASLASALCCDVHGFPLPTDLHDHVKDSVEEPHFLRRAKI